MTRNEFLNVTAFMTAMYPDKSPFRAGDVQKAAMEAWFAMLRDMEYSEVMSALQGHIRSSVYFPTIADIRREYDRRNAPKSALQAFVEVKAALRKFGQYRAEELFSALDERERSALRAFGLERFCSAPDNDFLLKEFEKYYDAAGTELAVV